MLKWSEICLHTSREAMEPISNIFHEVGFQGVVIEDRKDLEKEMHSTFAEIYDLDPNKYPKTGIYMKGYLPKDELVDQTVNDLTKRVNRLPQLGIDIGENHITIKEIDEQDWANAWKKYYKPLKISNTITIVPVWENYTPLHESEKIIQLDPGMAFGTGTHPTTILSMLALEKYVEQGDIVIDVGCGSGILSIAAILLRAEHVYAYDLDPVAVSSTISNVKLNQLSSKVTSRQNDLLKDVDLNADIIVSNILAEIIIKFVQDAWDNLKPNGLFITSGIIDQKKELVLVHLKQVGFEILEINEQEDWVSIVAKKK